MISTRDLGVTAILALVAVSLGFYSGFAVALSGPAKLAEALVFVEKSQCEIRSLEEMRLYSRLRQLHQRVLSSDSSDLFEIVSAEEDWEVVSIDHRECIMYIEPDRNRRGALPGSIIKIVSERRKCSEYGA